MENIRKRKGSIVIDNRVFRNLNEGALSALFSKFFPLHIENNLFMDKVTYYGLSPEFDEVGEGCVSPNYSCQITLSEDDEFIISFTK